MIAYHVSSSVLVLQTQPGRQAGIALSGCSTAKNLTQKRKLDFTRQRSLVIVAGKLKVTACESCIHIMDIDASETIHLMRTKAMAHAPSAVNCGNIACTHYHPSNYTGPLTLLADNFSISEAVLPILALENVLVKIRSAMNAAGRIPPKKIILRR